MAITQINEGRLEEAMSMLDDAVALSPKPDFTVHLVRGTARALQQRLKGELDCCSIVTLACSLCFGQELQSLMPGSPCLLR